MKMFDNIIKPKLAKLKGDNDRLIAQKAAEIASRESKIADLEKEAKVAKETLARQKKRVRELEANEATLRHQHKQSEAAHAGEKASREKAIAELEKEISAAKASQQTDRQVLKESTAAYNKLQEEYKALQQKQQTTKTMQTEQSEKYQASLKQSQETIAKLEKQLVDLEAGHKTSTQETKTKNARKHSELQNALTVARQEAAAAFKVHCIDI